jgi:hypothetical protein
VGPLYERELDLVQLVYGRVAVAGRRASALRPAAAIIQARPGTRPSVLIAGLPKSCDGCCCVRRAGSSLLALLPKGCQL